MGDPSKLLRSWTEKSEERKEKPDQGDQEGSSSIERMDNQSVLGDNDIDDVRWLCSLTESELDLLMGLKNLVHLRAKKVGHEDIAKKFDLRMLRTLSLHFMENLEGRLKDLPGTSGFGSNILNNNNNSSGDFGSMFIEDLYPFICSDKRKRIVEMFPQGMSANQKQKTGN